MDRLESDLATIQTLANRSPAFVRLVRALCQSLGRPYRGDYERDVRGDPTLVEPANAMQRLGPAVWRVMHVAMETIPDQAAAFVVRGDLAALLPCTKCATHLEETLRDFPCPSDNRSDWWIAIHNCVNVRLGKPTISRAAARQTVAEWKFHYKHDIRDKSSTRKRKRTSTSTSRDVVVIGAVLAAAVIGIAFLVIIR